MRDICFIRFRDKLECMSYEVCAALYFGRALISIWRYDLNGNKIVIQ